MVRELAEKLHFTGIYFHELFHDDMEIYVKERDRDRIIAFTGWISYLILLQSAV